MSDATLELPAELDAPEAEGIYGGGSTSIFDPTLCELVYRWFCPPGGTVLDPFAGGSVRGIVASKLGREYVGIDVRQVQVDANVRQADRICADGVAFVPESPPDYMPDVTPVEFFERPGVWAKREDYYTFAGVRGAKVRTCMFLIQQAIDAKAGVVTAGSRQSPQVNFVAQIANRMGVKCRVHVPSGEMTPELIAAKASGAEVVQHEYGYNSVIMKRAREDAAERGWVEIPYGMESEEAVTFTRPQVANLPAETHRIVNAVGSGMTLAGILWGLLDAGRDDVEVLGVCVGHAPTERLDRHAPPDWRSMVKLVEYPTDYHVPAKLTTFEGVMLDPWYEAKCMEYLQAGDTLWISAIRPSIIPAAAPMPRWICGDALEVGALAAGTEADLWFSCPPYGDLEVYSDDPRDLSTQEWPEFLANYRRIIAESCALLADDSFAVVLVGDFRGPDGLYRNFPGETIRAFIDAGLGYYNEAVLVTQTGSLVLRAGKQFDVSRKMGKTHQNLLVFVKGDARRATRRCGPIVSADVGDLVAMGFAEEVEE